MLATYALEQKPDISDDELQAVLCRTCAAAPVTWISSRQCAPCATPVDLPNHERRIASH